MFRLLPLKLLDGGKHASPRLYKNNSLPYMTRWSSGMILASGARSPGFNSRTSPVLHVC